MQTLKSGDLVAEKYRIERQLGLGGMGAVYAATHEVLGERFAIKVVLPEHASNKEVVGRFVNEARAAAKIRNEHVANVTDVGVLPNGSPYMVMEYLEGADLDEVLKARGGLPLPEAVDYVLQALEALAQAHALGIVHRDLKPSNLFLARRQDGSELVKVLDFGISKVTGEGVTSLTMTSHLLGSPLYMSPEQVRSAKDVDARTDIWSIGVILYTLLTKEPPFDGDTLGAVFASILETNPPRLSETHGMPTALDDVLAQCLTRERAQRFANAGELAHALLPFAPAASRSSVDRILRTLQMSAPPVRPSSPDLGTTGRDLTPAVHASTQLALDAAGIPAPGAASSGRSRLPVYFGAGVVVAALVGGVGVTMSRSTAGAASGAPSDGASATGLVAEPRPASSTSAPASASAAPSASATIGLAPLEAAPAAPVASVSARVQGQPSTKPAASQVRRPAATVSAPSAKPTAAAAEEPSPSTLFNRK